MIGQFLRAISCILVARETCKVYPSDPLASKRDSNWDLKFSSDGGHFSGFDFSRGISNPIVSVESGKLEGYVMKSIKGRPIFAFEGVPYAESTAGANRFELTVPKAPWPGVRPAKAPGSACLQRSPARLNPILGSEDCLFLNIYVPAEHILNGTGNLPVIVFIHGGSWYLSAGADYGPAYLLEHEVIFVTINYRLGIFGFLSTGDENMPGNLGMKDQRSALKWVHENIANFGGDPSRVTLTGYSAGGASVHYHMLSEPSHKYFSAAVAMSGTAFSPYTLMNKKHVKEMNRRIATRTNCPLTSSRAFVDCLRKVDGKRLAQIYRRLFDIATLPAAPLAMVIEEDRPGAFLTEHPADVYARNGTAKIPFICSMTAEEGSSSFPLVESIQNIWYSRIASGRLARNRFKKLVPILLEYKYAPNADSVSEQIIDFYMKKDGKPRLGNLTAIGQMAADRLIGYGVHTTLQRHSQVAQTYSYFYAYHGRYAGSQRILGGDPKQFSVGHLDDLVSITNMTFDGYKGYKTTDPEYAVIKLMTSLLYNFAARREPLYTDEKGNDKRIWTPVTDPRNIRVLRIDEKVEMIPEPYKNRLKFWETVDLPDLKPLAPYD